MVKTWNGDFTCVPRPVKVQLMYGLPLRVLVWLNSHAAVSETMSYRKSRLVMNVAKNDANWDIMKLNAILTEVALESRPAPNATQKCNNFHDL